MKRVLWIKRNPGQGLHVTLPPPSALAARHTREVHLLVTSRQAALLHVHQPEGVRRIDTHQNVVAAVKSQPHHPVHREAETVGVFVGVDEAGGGSGRGGSALSNSFTSPLM